MLPAEDLLTKITGAVYSPATDWEWDTLEAQEFLPDFDTDPVARISDPYGRERDEGFSTINTELGNLAEFEPYTQDPLGMDFSSQESTTETRDEYQDIGAPAVGVTQAQNQNTSGGINEDRFMKKYDNGRIPEAKLMEVKGLGRYRIDAARAMKAMKRAAKKDGIILTGGGYRSYEEQAAVYAQKPDLAAPPGKSEHGWGVASDMNVGDYGSAVYQWLAKNGKKFGWVNPSWAQAGGSKPEPWHWEYQGGFKAAGTSKPKRKNPRLVQQADPLNRLERIDSLIFAPTVFGSVAREVTNAPETPEEYKKREANKGLGFVPAKLRPFFDAAAEKYGVPARLLASMAQTESGFNKDAVSEAGAQGVMQVMPLHGMKNPFNARANILKGAEIFASYINAAKAHDLSREYGVIPLALAMYNAGPNNTDAVLISRISAYAEPILERYRNG